MTALTLHAGPACNPWHWGGGPFQNGTNNLQQLWCEEGFRRHVLGVDMQQLNTEVERELNDAPPRDYFAHAAGRLARLIDTVREQSLNSLTLGSHSQGTMPEHVEFMKRVVAYDLPVGFCGSYTRENWIKLIKLADWTGYDRYFGTGKVETPPMPPEIDHETVSEQIRRADEERIKQHKTYGGT